MNPAIQGYVDALLEAADAEQTRRMAEDATAVVRLVAENRQLRAALTDTSIAPPARRAVMDELLEDRVSNLARRAVAFAASAAAAPEVPPAISWVAMEASRAVEGDRAHGPHLGRTASRQRVGGFTTAIEEELSVGELEEIEDALFRFARTVDATPALRDALTSQDLPVAVRQEVVDDLIAQKVGRPTLRLVDYVVRAGRPRDLVGTLDWLVDQTAAARGWRVARVRAARELDENQRTQLAESLSRLSGAPVDLEVTIDPGLIGGAVIHIGDLQVDASARGRLEQLREHLLPGGWEESTVGAPHRGAQSEPGDEGSKGARG